MGNISKSLEETNKIALDFVQNLEPQKNRATVVGLYGDLGSGKTTFTQSVAKVLGVRENITSPTFVIEKIYNLSNIEHRTSKFYHLIHIDAYRLEKSEELLHLGWQETISDSKNLILIEWPERVSVIMPEHIKVRFETLEGQNSREINIEV